MANPTTNYGFVLPTSSDLVTDLPADFDVALQGVDTRLKALQPGTTAGDLAYSSATANTNTRLALGTAGQVLKVNSGATAPEWGSLSTGFVGARAFVSTAQTANSGTLTYAALTAESYDTSSFHDNVTDNSRFTIPAGKAGKYIITANGWIANPGVAAGNNRGTLYKNASTIICGLL